MPEVLDRMIMVTALVEDVSLIGGGREGYLVAIVCR
jgi:hypothetical protein